MDQELGLNALFGEDNEDNENQQGLGLNMLFGEDNENNFEDSENQRAEEGYMQALHRIMTWEDEYEDDPTLDLELLDLSGLGLKTMPPLPDGLRMLNCENNLLETLGEDYDALPRTLISLECGNNRLTALPDPLPPYLYTLDCESNKLTRLPEVLPDTIARLCVDRNQITELPAALPENLEMLSVDENLLTELPEALPATLTSLYASKNRLTRLPAVLPRGLTSLLVNGNQITEFTEFPPDIDHLYLCKNPAPGPLPPLPPALKRLTVCGLGIKALPLLPPKLEMLRASENKLTSLPTLPATLTDMCVGHNYLTSLPLPLPPNLEVLGAVWNRLGHLPDPEEFPKTITTFWFDGNALPNEEEGESLHDYLDQVKRCFVKYQKRIAKRTQTIFDELMALTWHPDRVDARRACGIAYDEM
jgi:Leucine-rich repeat (LRR) protein